LACPRQVRRRAVPDTGELRRSPTAILPPWCRWTSKITEVLLLLHGCRVLEWLLERSSGAGAGGS
jgi:hypothetical protein